MKCPKFPCTASNIKVAVNKCNSRCKPSNTYETIRLKPNFYCKINSLTQEILYKENAKYVIEYDFSLLGQTITVPKNCILEFDGGTLSNGTIIGQDTYINDVGGLGVDTLFGEGITREGTWRMNEGGGSFEQVQSDWNQSDSTKPDYIKNKPTIPSGGGDEDKPYDPDAHSGLGRKTLQLKDGSNVLTQEDLNNPNTIYVISYDFDLNGKTIEVPEGCILEFNGGSLNNGKCIGNATKLLNYDGRSDALYGPYKSINNELLNNCYTDISDFHVTECHRFVDDIVNYEGLTEYQNIVRYGNYLFLLGYPWVKAGATDTTHYPLFIRVFALDKYRFVGTVYTSVQSHANGATIAGDTLYVCVSDGNKYNEDYINPDRKCLHTFNCGAIIDRAQSASSTPIPNGRIDLSMFESNIGREIAWVEGIDYDKVNEEFAIDFAGIIVVTDKDFNYIRKTEDYKSAILLKYNYQVGDQDLSYKNGIVYGFFCRYDKGADTYHNAAHTTIVTIDTLSGKVVDVKDMLNNHSWWESQGAFKDPDDERQLWTLMVERRYDVAVNAVTVFTICKIAPTKLTLKDTGNSIPTDSYIKPLINNGKYLNIYVDDTANNTIQDGTITYPYKSLHQAIHTTMTLSENVAFMCKRGGTYEAQFTNVVNRAIRIQSYGTGNSPIVKVNGAFTNCHVSITNITLVPIVGINSHQGAAFFLTNCVFLFSNSIVRPLNYDESITDANNYHNKNNWIISDGFVSAQCSYVDINYCLFIGLQYVLYSLKVLNGTVTDTSFEQVGSLLQVVAKGTANIGVKNPNTTWYTEITKLVIASDVVTTEPFVRFCGWTINNSLIALIVSRKNGMSGITSYKQLDSRTFTEGDVSDDIIALVRQEFSNVITEQTPLAFEGKLEQGEYIYNESRFEDAYYHILGCALRGNTNERPSLTYPFLVKMGMQYFDFEQSDFVVWNGTQWISIGGNGSGQPAENYKTLSIGDSILLGVRNGSVAFLPYITSRYKQDAISGARLTIGNGYNIKDIPQQLVDETSYTPDIIIAGTGVNDWALNAPLGTPPVTIVTSDTEAEALDRTTVYGAVQYLFYQMIKKFPKAQRFFVSATKFDCNVNEAIHGKYVDLNTQGYSYVDLLEGIKKLCARYGVVYIDVLNKSLVNTEFATYKAPTKYDNVPEADRATWNATYYVDADGLHPTDLCYKEVFTPIIKKELK